MIKTFLLPAVSLIDRLRYPSKFGLILFIIMIPLLLLSISLISSVNEDIRLIENERRGLVYIKALRQPIEHIQQHRGMTHAFLNGSREFYPRIINKRPVIDDYMAALVAVDNHQGKSFGTTDQLRVLNRQWLAIKASSLEQVPAIALTTHSDLLANMLKLMGTVADASTLTLDPKLDSYYLGYAVSRSLASLIESMGLACALGSGVATRGTHTQQSFIQLSVLSSKIDLNAENSGAALKTASRANQTIGARLGTEVLANSRAISDMQSLLKNLLLDSEAVSIDGGIVFETATAAISGSYGLYDAITLELDRLLEKRIGYARSLKSLTLFFVVGALVLVTYLFAGFYCSVMESIKLIGCATRQVAQGNLLARLDLNSDDELQQVATDFNAMTEQRQRAESLRWESEQKIRDLLDSTVEAIFGLDKQGSCTFANPSCVGMLGYQDVDELVGRNMHELFHFYRPDEPEIAGEDCTVLRSFLMGRSMHLDTESLCRADGSRFPVEFRSHPIRRNNEVIGAVVTFMDITERKAQEAHIMHQAHFDSLTHLPNRFLSLDRLSQQLSDAQRCQGVVAVLFLDLDDFKVINDTLGHETGDSVLKMTAQRLRGTLRSGDTVGRLGGDEFIILLGGLLDAEDALPVVENVLKQFRDPFIIDGRELMLTTSVGISVYPGDGKTPSELLRNADAAMYHSKEQGRNTYSYFTESLCLQ